MIDAQRQPLTRARILEEAMRLVDREGLANLTMRRLGRALGVEGMALYNYFPNKAALLDGLSELMLDEMDPRYGQKDDWAERMRAIMRSFRTIGLAHPDVFLMFGSGRALHSGLRRPEESLGILQDAGFDPKTAAFALRSLIGFVFGSVAFELAGRDPRAREQAVAREAAAARFPHYAASMRHFVSSAASFEFGLGLLIDALRRTPRPTRATSAGSPASARRSG